MPININKATNDAFSTFLRGTDWTPRLIESSRTDSPVRIDRSASDVRYTGDYLVKANGFLLRGRAETALLYGNFAKALRKYLRPRVYIRAVCVCVDLLVYLTDPRRAARIAPSRKLIYLLTGEKNCCYHPESPASTSGKAAAISASSSVPRRIAWRAALSGDSE